MQIVINEQLKDAIEWTCKYANEYKVDIDIHIDTDGEVSVSVCPTYRDRDKAETPQAETKGVGYCNECKWFRNKQVCGRCRSKNLFAEADTPQTDVYDYKGNGK